MHIPPLPKTHWHFYDVFTVILTITMAYYYEL